MVILIFGVSNVGKTAIGKKMAEKLDYSFVDLDEEIKKTFHTTLENFMKENPWPHERYIVKGKVLKRIIEDHKENNTVIAVSPIYEARNFSSLLVNDYIMAVELQDAEEHIFERLVFSDENDVIYQDDEYKEEHRDYYMEEIHQDIVYAKRIFKKITWKYFIDNKSIEQASEELSRQVLEKIIDRQMG